MKLRYDKSLKLLGIGVSPFLRLGPQLWFDDYQIASYYDWDITGKGTPFIQSAVTEGIHLPGLNTQSMLNSPSFQQCLIKNYKNRAVLTYKPVQLKVPPVLVRAGFKFLGTMKASKNFENKADFRQTLGAELPFPDFQIKHLSEIERLGDVKTDNEPIVLQHETMSGGKGTFVVRQPSDLTEALGVYEAFKKKRPRIVISKYIEHGQERSLQCCVTKYGTLVGPMQRQIISAPELCNTQLAGAEKFCGAQISEEPGADAVYKQMVGMAKKVGTHLDEIGYRGIFGLDFLIDRSGRLYLLEINQRLTGVTPLLTMLCRPEHDIPFLLLHILELSKTDYEVEDFSVDNKPSQGSLMILHSHSAVSERLEGLPSSGLYAPDLKFIKSTFELSPDSETTLFQRYAAPGATVKAGAKMAMVFSRQRVLKDEILTPIAKATISQIYGKTQPSNLD